MKCSEQLTQARQPLLPLQLHTRESSDGCWFKWVKEKVVAAKSKGNTDR